MIHMPNQHIVITHVIVCWIKWVKNLNIILNQKKECGKNFIICQYMRSTNIPDMINAQTSEYQPCQLLQEMPLYSNSNKPQSYLSKEPQPISVSRQQVFRMMSGVFLEGIARGYLLFNQAGAELSSKQAYYLQLYEMKKLLARLDH